MGYGMLGRYLLTLKCYKVHQLTLFFLQEICESGGDWLPAKCDIGFIFVRSSTRDDIIFCCGGFYFPQCKEEECMF